jgi:hypothetical protein
MPHRCRACLAAVPLLALSVNVASAQPPATPPGGPPAVVPPPYSLPPSPGDRIPRDGFVAGAGIGLGSLRAANESFRSWAFSAMVGGMLSPRLALLLDYHFLSRQLDSFTSLSHSGAVAAAQLFVFDYFWAKGGLGIAWLAASQGSAWDTSGVAPAFLLAAGAEPLQTTDGFALDVQVRLLGARHRAATGALVGTNFVVLLGFNWY